MEVWAGTCSVPCSVPVYLPEGVLLVTAATQAVWGSAACFTCCFLLNLVAWKNCPVLLV